MLSPFAIIAWYGVLLIGGQWGLVGPYDNREECTKIMEWLDSRGYETETCTMIDTGVESDLVILEVDDVA